MNDELARQYLSVWLNLQCVGIRENRLIRVNGNTCDDVESVMLAVSPAGGCWKFYSESLPRFLIEQIEAVSSIHDENIAIILDRGGFPVTEIRREITHYFPVAPLIETPDVSFLGDTADTFDTFAVMKNGVVASRSWSIRKNDISAEIAVETDERYRRRGYGRQVVAAWAKHQINNGKEAIYSHRKGNIESWALAKSAWATQFIEVLSYH